MFNATDYSQFESLGISREKIEQQIAHFQSGFPFMTLQRPATVGDGIIQFDENSRQHYVDYFNKKSSELTMQKFVPASGAASRMFKQLFEFLEQHPMPLEGNPNPEIAKEFKAVYDALDNLERFAFYSDLKDVLAQNGIDIQKALQEKDFGTIINFILTEKGLGYASLPKALLKFHNYPDGSRVAAEEHLVEAAHYTKDSSGISRIHFTLSPEHIEKFTNRLNQVVHKYQKQFATEYRIDHSIQKKSTDMIAVDEHNEPFRNANGSILFRPGGHGALLENLNELDADLIFIKNIDNIVPDHLRATTYEYKKVIGGYLLAIQEITNAFLLEDDAQTLSDDGVSMMWGFAVDYLHLPYSKNEGLTTTEKRLVLRSFLNRPMRVCGMVKNEGEPGGGPFWVLDNQGHTTLQIVESSQIDFSKSEQKRIVDHSTHFNPVDLVCIIKNYKGEKFDLSEFVDPMTGFISKKSSGGKTLKAQELPGLWNGAMAHWITLFVEVPIITFNPVKTVNDLLRKEHQA